MKLVITTIIICIAAFSSNPLLAQLTISQVLCNQKINPAGVAASDLKFSWLLADTHIAAGQYAYQVAIASSLQKLKSASYDVYNSGKIQSPQSYLVTYSGRALQPATAYYWHVTVWDKNSRQSTSQPGSFITGLPSANDWAGAKWIGYEERPESLIVAPGVHGLNEDPRIEKLKQRTVVPLFRKSFTVKPHVVRALAYISGLGQYEMSVNGSKTGTAFLAPGWTDYNKTCLYNTYDISNQLHEGSNAIGITVGNGFYNINQERYYKITLAYGNPKLICRIKILYADGTSENTVSGESWKTSASPITFSSIYGGEDYDARLEQSGWNLACFNDAAWKHAVVVRPPAGSLAAEEDYPVSVMDSFTVKRITRTAANTYLYDFGQNISGIIRLAVKGKKGDTIKLYPAELLNADKTINQDASGSPYYFTYTLRGDTVEYWQPKFTYYGFRYVQVQNADTGSSNAASTLPQILKLTLLHTRNSAPANGTFQCSNKLFNNIYSLINYAIKSNIQSVVTDCPHREKLSWLEQDYLMGTSINYNYNVYHLYRKLVTDMIAAQTPEGLVPDIAPEYVEFEGGFCDSPEWGSAAVVLPWLLYTWYGDTAILYKAYPMIKRYTAYLKNKSNNNILNHGLGDWFDYGPNSPGEAQLTPKALTATAIYYYDVQLQQQIAAIIGKPGEATLFQQQAQAIKESFNQQFFNAQTQVYATGSQTAMAMPLCVGLVEERNRKAVLQNLIDTIKANGKALTAGDIGFHFLVKALDDGGASQLLYNMNARDDVPGYGYQLKKGATALTESWPALESVSNNHLMLGHVMEWLYSGVAGISQMDNSVAYRHIKIRPQPVGDITWAKASFQSPYGEIVSDWEKQGSKFLLHVKIPVGTTATVFFPVKAGAGITENSKKIIAEKLDESIVIKNVAAGEYYYEASEQ